jgi:hypothetical protein
MAIVEGTPKDGYLITNDSQILGAMVVCGFWIAE